MNTMLHRSLIAATFALCLAPFAALAQSSDVLLFKIVSARDEIVIGLPKARVDALGAGTPIELVAKEMAKVGQFPAWQYGPRRDAQGQGRFSPVQRVVVFAPGVIRLESYTTDMPVAAPAN
jgi:hypothetical protein